jgi:hypothetical protein
VGDDRARLHAQAHREGYRLIRSLLKSLLIAAALVPFSLGLPFAAVWLCRTPGGAEFLFWTGPWSCCVLVLFYSQLSACKFWLGAEHVRQWREANGGLLHTSLVGCFWMFGALICSYIAEFAMIFLVRPSASGRALLPIFTYSPLAFAWIWRHARG